jgi:hypothetical protein
MKIVRLSALRTGRLYPSKYSWYSFLLEAESNPRPQCGRKDFVKEKFRYHYREWNPRPSICSAVPYPTGLWHSRTAEYVRFVCVYEKIARKILNLSTQLKWYINNFEERDSSIFVLLNFDFMFSDESTMTLT